MCRCSLMSNETERVIRLLRQGATAISAALIILENGGEIAIPQATEPQKTETGECAHANKARGMGGYWHCKDCGVSGRDE